MGDRDLVSHFDTAVVGIDFTNQDGTLVGCGPGDDAATQQTGRDALVGFVLFPDGDGVTGIEVLLCSDRKSVV